MSNPKYIKRKKKLTKNVDAFASFAIYEDYAQLFKKKRGRPLKIYTVPIPNEATIRLTKIQIESIKKYDFKK